MKSLLAELKTSLLLTFALVVLLCGAYPLAVWAGAQVLFPAKANGSLLVDANGTVRGSALLAQNFSSDKYFQPRPSAAGAGYDATSSGGTNLGPTSQKLAWQHPRRPSAAYNDPGNQRHQAVAEYRVSGRDKSGRYVPVPAAASIPTSAWPTPNFRRRAWPAPADWHLLRSSR